jgi:hypothetical protein
LAVYNGCSHEIKLKIPKKLGRFNLVSCAIRNVDHVITGFVCEGKYYIYDSNSWNYPIEFDWSTQNLTDIRDKRHLFTGNEIKFAYLIYA